MKFLLIGLPVRTIYIKAMNGYVRVEDTKLCRLTYFCRPSSVFTQNVGYSRHRGAEKIFGGEKN